MDTLQNMRVFVRVVEAGSFTKAAAKLGVTAQEIAKLCDAVIAALEKGPLAPDDLRAATGKATRNLGEEGKKKGVATTLPLALGELQASGDILQGDMARRTGESSAISTLVNTSGNVNLLNDPYFDPKYSHGLGVG